ncbi:ubiquitin carboxyl-terminal hydrolase [Anaeramoeba flamelloides]|uniref:Ubiquitin carboxyl-terminal hydrolase n=1 Tax=Anaeramoeba flamelloides TaxID=1746091 RepID=A0AAV7ZDN9_9EUKA|nr:ubiquitin carboxyl-terminal hydrolase [Anaeramoeba flamelloides]
METFEKEDDDDDDEDQKEEGVKKKRVNNKSKIVNNADNVDTALAGLLKLISLLYQNKETFNLKFNKEIEQVFVKDIFCTYLFSLINKNHKFYGTLPKCKAFLTRDSAFKMLSNLIKTDINNFSILLPFIYKQINRIDYNKEWADHDKKQNLNEFETFQIQDNIHNFVGLTNQSATCYMNSVLQQLYAVLDFRKEILSTALPEIPENQLSDAGKVLRELQIVFHSLKDKQIRYFNTRKFCQVFKWTDNQPINVTQQQDANEFLNLLFNFIDEGLRECSQQRLFHDVFGGSLIHQVICQQEQHKSERIEQFYTVSLDVKNKSHLLESLSSFIQPDHLIDDNAYHCSRCSKKVNALKRCSFLALPNTLILHLKRFDFDLQTLTMTKINSRLEFPFNLDMKPYTLEGIIEDEKKRRKNKKKQKLLKKNKTGNENEQDNNNDDEEDGDMDYDDSESDMSSDEDNELDGIQVENRPGSYYKYKIIGIVVHSGTHNFGHYYSYIRDHHQEFKIGNEGEQGNENGMDKEKIKEKEIIEELNNNILIDEDTSSDENNSIDDKDKKDKIDKGVWNEFNDVRVTAFDIDTIDENAYGSNEIKIDENEKEGLRKYNAYMLVYQRVEYFEAKKKEEIGIIEEEQLKLEKEKEKLKEQEEEKKKQEELEKEEEEEQKRLQVIDENEIDEKQLIKLYQPEYIDFLWDLIQQDLTKIDKQYFKEQIEKQLIKNNKGIKINNNNNDDDEDPIFLIIKLATIYALDVISHSKKQRQIGKMDYTITILLSQLS